MTFWTRAFLAAVLLPCGAAEGQRRQATPEERSVAEAAVARFTSPTLARFGSEAEFQNYVKAVGAYSRMRWYWYARSGAIRFAQGAPQGNVQSDTVEPLCPPDDPECLPQASDEWIVVTGSAVTPSNPSITNNQMAGVEEGDVVKQIGQFLLILQDGRIFVVDTRAGGRRLALADRMNVYRDRSDDIWYDEMLVFGDRVLITGYSYGEDATELSVFRLSEAGRLTREGVFHLSSNDYYSTTNYATRLIGDQLVVYTPFSVRDMARTSFSWPVVRRWLPDEEREEAERRGRPLFDATSIYRPVRNSFDPVIHTVSICPLGPVEPAGDLECRSTAFVAPSEAQWYVTDSDVYVWTWSSRRDAWDTDRNCLPGERFSHDQIAPALLYRVPAGGAAPGVVGGRGTPIDQFSFQAGDGRLRVMLNRQPEVCYPDWSRPADLSYLSIALSRFGPSLDDTLERDYSSLPSTGTRWIANRFTDRYLVYGGLSRFRSGLPDIDEEAYEDDEEGLRIARQALAMPPAFAMPIDRPQDVRELAVGHTVIRAERVADDIVLTGYRDRQGLQVTLIDLDRTPRIAGNARLDGRFESEGRSHAFNSLVESGGGGLLGLPTVPRIRESGRYWWRSRASDLSYLSFDRRGALSPLGELESRVAYDDHDEDGNPHYECEVSCIDWYGNSRPIFTGGRIFALTGTELIEGQIRDEEMVEVRRLELTGPIPAS